MFCAGLMVNQILVAMIFHAVQTWLITMLCYGTSRTINAMQIRQLKSLTHGPLLYGILIIMMQNFWLHGPAIHYATQQNCFAILTRDGNKKISMHSPTC